MDQWFRENRASQPRTIRGSLIIPLRFKTSKRFLSECDKCELVMLARSYSGMSGPQFDATHSKERLYIAIRVYFLRQYPGLQLNNNRIPFTTVNTTTNSSTNNTNNSSAQAGPSNQTGREYSF